jgi:hypothetical protein
MTKDQKKYKAIQDSLARQVNYGAISKSDADAISSKAFDLFADKGAKNAVKDLSAVSSASITEFKANTKVNYDKLYKSYIAPFKNSEYDDDNND